MIDLNNKTFGDLLVVGQHIVHITKGGNKVIKWPVKCACGFMFSVQSCHLLSGATKRCRKCADYNNRKSGIYAKFFNRIKRSAKLREISFCNQITRAYLNELYERQQGRCAITGLPIRFASSSIESENGGNTASLDRIDSNRSYEIDNIHWVHKDVNKVKGSLELDIYLMFCREITENKKIACEPLENKINNEDNEDPVPSIVISKKDCGYIIKCSCGSERIVTSKPKSPAPLCKECYYKTRQTKNTVCSKKWYSILHGAKNRGFTVSISREQAWNLYLQQNKRCAYTSRKIHLAQSDTEDSSNATLDRIDSSKGYEPSNVQWVHTSINKMKMDLTDERFREICKLSSSTAAATAFAVAARTSVSL